MSIIIVGFGAAGKHYLKLLKNKSKKIYVLDDKKIPSNKYYNIISIEEIINKKLFFKFNNCNTIWPSLQTCIFFFKKRFSCYD